MKQSRAARNRRNVLTSQGNKFPRRNAALTFRYESTGQKNTDKTREAPPGRGLNDSKPPVWIPAHKRVKTIAEVVEDLRQGR